MRQRKIALGLAVAAILGLSTIGSNAGTVATEYSRINGVEIAGKLSNGKGTFRFWLQRLEGVYAFNDETHAYPAPGTPKAAVYLDRGPVQNTTSALPYIGGALFQGCISVKTAQGSDIGCEVLKSTTLNLDPLGQGGTVNFSVYSTAWKPRQLVVNLIVSGNQDLGPDADNKLTPTITPAPPASGPYTARIEAAQLLTRSLAVTGSVSSEHLYRTYRYGGGAITSTTTSMFYTGLHGYSRFDSHGLVCQPSLPNGCLP